MNQFGYRRATSVQQAAEAGAEAGAMVIAGGTNVIDLMKGNVVRPECLVDITRLPGLDGIDLLPDGGARVGALVRDADLAQHPQFAARFPAVAEALLSGASAQLRNAASVGGNLLQRTRCAYFLDTASAFNKRVPGTGCDAKGGENRLHAVLGWSEHCIATHPSDFCVPLAAFDAVAEIDGPRGRQEVAVEALHCLPGTTPHIETSLTPGELILAVRLPREAASFAPHARYLKVRERTSYAFAVVSVAAGLRLEDGRIAEARLALGGVSAKPWRPREAEDALRSRAPGEEAFANAAAAALAGALPSGANGFKIQLARGVVARVLREAARGTPARLPALPASAVNLAGELRQ